MCNIFFTEILQEYKYINIEKTISEKIKIFSEIVQIPTQSPYLFFTKVIQ